MTNESLIDATYISESGIKAMKDRASSRDTESERSMKSAVNAFNAMFNFNMTEEQGWFFMVLLKMSRSKQGNFTLDDYVDGSAYFSLAGESAAVNRLKNND